MISKAISEKQSRIHSLFFVTLSIVSSLYFFGCAATTKLLVEHYTEEPVLPVEQLCPEEIHWEKVIPGVEKTGHIIKNEKIKWECVKIDLNTPDIKIHSTPAKEQLHKRFILKKFSKETNSTVAINTVPFDLDGGTYIPVSIVKIDGEIICPENDGYSALGFIKNKDGTWRAKVIPKQTSEEIEQTDYAFGGFYTILYDETIFEFEKYKRSRSAAGVNAEGDFLYLFAACGINCPTGRNGLNFEECALILKELGCYMALEFDGGHSTGLTLQGQELLKPVLQRKVPAMFGLEFPEY